MLACCPREGRTQLGAPWLPAGFKLKPCRMLAVHLGFGIDVVSLLVIIMKNKYIWTQKPCTNSFALWREKGVGPIYETLDLVKKGQSIVPGCGFEPELLERRDFGCNGKGAEAEASHGFEQQGGAGAGQESGAVAEQCPEPPSLSQQGDSLRLLALPFLAALSFRACCSR